MVKRSRALAAQLVEGSAPPGGSDARSTGSDAGSIGSGALPTRNEARRTSSDECPTSRDASPARRAALQASSDALPSRNVALPMNSDDLPTGSDASPIEQEALPGRPVALQAGRDLRRTGRDALRTGRDPRRTGRDAVRGGIDARSKRQGAFPTGTAAFTRCIDTLQTRIDALQEQRSTLAAATRLCSGHHDSDGTVQVDAVAEGGSIAFTDGRSYMRELGGRPVGVSASFSPEPSPLPARECRSAGAS
jgi:hypothetical protein